MSTTKLSAEELDQTLLTALHGGEVSRHVAIDSIRRHIAARTEENEAFVEEHKRMEDDCAELKAEIATLRAALEASPHTPGCPAAICECGHEKCRCTCPHKAALKGKA